MENQTTLRKALNTEKLALLEQKQKAEEKVVSQSVSLEELKSRCEKLTREREEQDEAFSRAQVFHAQALSAAEERFTHESTLCSRAGRDETKRPCNVFYTIFLFYYPLFRVAFRHFWLFLQNAT